MLQVTKPATQDYQIQRQTTKKKKLTWYNSQNLVISTTKMSTLAQISKCINLKTKRYNFNDPVDSQKCSPYSKLSALDLSKLLLSVTCCHDNSNDK